MKFKFEGNPNSTNEIMDVTDDCFISYNDMPGGGISVFEGDDGSDETALVIKGDVGNRYLILNGDFRQEYIAAAPDGLEGCMEVYHKNIESKSSWTTGEED